MHTKIQFNSLMLLACLLIGTANALLIRKFHLLTNQLIINSSVSTDLMTDYNINSETSCVMRCGARDCAVAVFYTNSRICQLLIIIDESSGVMASNQSHVIRQLVSDGYANVWKSDDFEMEVQKKSFPWRSSVTFSNSNTLRNGSIQYVLINMTGCYRIEAYGARGGNTSTDTFPGGNGASVVGYFDLVAGTQLSIVVGQKGGDSTCFLGAGGGGGSFVYRSNDSYLYIASGGGGGSSDVSPGGDGRAETSGGNSTTPTTTGYLGLGGTHGNPGGVSVLRVYSAGGAGAGWNGNGTPSINAVAGDGFGGANRFGNWLGGDRGGPAIPGFPGVGGFGGGGGAGKGGGSCAGGSGGGGGYSGGGASTHFSGAGGGGGSFCAGIRCVATTGRSPGDHGSVTIRVPKETTGACEFIN